MSDLIRIETLPFRPMDLGTRITIAMKDGDQARGFKAALHDEYVWQIGASWRAANFPTEPDEFREGYEAAMSWINKAGDRHVRQTLKAML